MESVTITSKKLVINFILIIILFTCLCITTYALVQVNVSVDNNLFNTGIVKINLNDEKPIIEEHEFIFEPGMTVVKKFFIENQSTWDVYYKLYFDDIEGGLANVLEITIKDNDKILYKGKASELTKDNVGAANDILKLNERRDLTAIFYFPKESGNEAKNLYLSFSLNAKAVQTKNNPKKLFN